MRVWWWLAGIVEAAQTVHTPWEQLNALMAKEEHSKEPSELLVTSDFEFVRERVDYTVHSHDSALRLAETLRDESAARPVPETPVIELSSASLEALCAFYLAVIPPLRQRRGKEFVLVSVGVKGEGSPFHPAVRPHCQPNATQRTLQPNATQRRLGDEERPDAALLEKPRKRGRSLALRLLDEPQLRAWFVSQHWPSHRLEIRDLVGEVRARGWNSRYETWPLDWSEPCVQPRRKLRQIPLGLHSMHGAKVRAFNDVFAAVSDSRPTLVVSALTMHAGRDLKFEALRSAFGAPLLNERFDGAVPETAASVVSEEAHNSPLSHVTYFDYVKYFESIATAKFVLSPVGSGLDCYRHWEALALGAVPIVEYSPVLADLFAHLPVLMVTSWNESIDSDLLERFYERVVVHRRYDFASLLRSSWAQGVDAAAGRTRRRRTTNSKAARVKRKRAAAEQGGVQRVHDPQKDQGLFFAPFFHPTVTGHCPTAPFVAHEFEIRPDCSFLQCRHTFGDRLHP